MANPTETVKAFLGAWAPPGGYKKAMDDYMTTDCVYENIGLTKSTGPVESTAVIKSFEAMGFTSLKVDWGTVMANGNTVVTERVDHLNDSNGKTLMSLRVLGIFEVRDNKISAWRDYFDTAPFAPKS